ncbi:hypothetical protein D3C76_1375080 [compost metagenome]
MQFDPQQADRRAIGQLRRVIRPRQDVELQRTWLGRMSEARLPLKNARPRIAVDVHCAVQHERQLLIEFAVLVRHLSANHPTTQLLHSLGNTDVCLQLFFARVPR